MNLHFNLEPRRFPSFPLAADIQPPVVDEYYSREGAHSLMSRSCGRRLTLATYERIWILFACIRVYVYVFCLEQLFPLVSVSSQGICQICGINNSARSSTGNFIHGLDWNDLSTLRYIVKGDIRCIFKLKFFLILIDITIKRLQIFFSQMNNQWTYNQTIYDHYIIYSILYLILFRSTKLDYHYYNFNDLRTIVIHV